MKVRTAGADMGELYSTDLKVALFDTSDPSEPYGGQAAFLRSVLPHLQADVTLYVGRSANASRLEPCTLDGVTVPIERIVRTPPPGRRPFVPVRLRALLGAWRVRRKILRDYDVVYVHSPELAIPFVRRPREVALVLHMHGSSNPLAHSRYAWARSAFPRWLYERCMASIIRESDYTIAVDQQGAAMCKSLSGDAATPVVVIPTAVGDSWFACGAMRAAGDTARPRKLVFVGRLETGKGVDVLLDSLEILLTRDPHLQATIAGEGTRRNDLQARAAEIGLSSRIAFPGWLTPSEVMAVLGTADALLLPSMTEGMPVSVLEALACGVPVVATPVGALPSLIREGINGALVTGRSAEAFAAATEAVLQQNLDPQQVSSSVNDYRAAYVAADLRSVVHCAHGRTRVAS